MTNPLVPSSREEEIREEQKHGPLINVVVRAEEPWKPGMVCLHRDVQLNGHCRQCGECRDRALCAIGMDAINRPANYRYVTALSFFRRNILPILGAAFWVWYVLGWLR